MKLLCFSDLHLTNRNPKFKLSGGVSDLLLRQEKFVEWIVEESKNYDAIFFLGDWSDYATLDPVTQTYSNRLIHKLGKADKPVIFLEGNHCISDTKNQFTVLGAAAEFDFKQSEMYFITQNDVIDLKIGKEAVRLYCAPYRSDYRDIEYEISKASVKAAEEDFLSILIFHFPSSNAVLDNGLESGKGVNLSAEITEGFDICIGGDFHKHQQLVNNDKAWYTGAPFDLNFGDHEDGRGAMSVELKDGEWIVEQIPQPHIFPILKIPADEILKLTEEELQNGVYKVSGEVTTEQRVQLQQLRKIAYKLDIGKPKLKNDSVAKDVEYMSVVSQKNDLRILQIRVSSDEYGAEEKQNILELFQDVEKAVHWK